MRIYFALIFVLLGWMIGSGFAQVSFKSDAQRQAAFRCILSDELAQIYDQINDLELKHNWEQRYWKLFDPTPETDQNEIYDLFIERFRYAQKYYSNSVPPLFLDDRGKYYLKYGEPDDRVISSGVGKAYRDNETWVYYSYNLFVDFVDQLGFGYREVPSLFDAITSGPANAKTSMAAELYVERASLHQKYQGFSAIVDGSAGLSSEARFYQLSRELANEKRLALEAAPASNFEFFYHREQLEAQMSCATFRGEENLTKVECYYSFPLRQLKFSAGQDFPLESLIVKTFLLFNENLEKILHREETVKLVAQHQTEIEKRIYINQHNEQLPAGLYYVILKLESSASNRLAVLRGQLRVRHFRADTLEMSDIQLSAQIRAGVKDQRHLKPNNLLVVPYVGNAIRQTVPIYIYFEIYNLTLNDQGNTRFQINYELQSLAQASSPLAAASQFISHLVKGNQALQHIGSSFESEGQSEFQQVYLLIDFSNMPSGACQMNIKVTDLESGATVLRQKRFVLK